MSDKTIKSPGLILGLDGHAMSKPIGINSKHESNLSLMNMLKEQNQKATHFAQVMAGKVDGIKRAFRSFVQVAGPLADELIEPSRPVENAVEEERAVRLAEAVNEFIAVMEEQLSVGSLAGELRK